MSLALFLAAAMIVASCSSTTPEADDPVAGSTSGLDGAPGSVSSAATSSTTVFVAPSDEDEEVETILDLEAEWAQRRAVMAASLSVEQFGVDDDNVLTGPGRFSVDLDGCPQAWDDGAGVDPTTIEIAMIAPQTGQFSAFGDIAVGMDLYFDWINANGGIEGRSIELTVLDDSFDAELAADAVATVLGGETEPLYITTTGSPGSLAVHDDLNDACVPHPFVVSPHPALADPADHPFTMGFQLSYSTEAILWGTWIKENLPGMVPVRVGALVMDNEFGRVYADTFEAWAEANRDIVSEIVIVKHDPASLTVSPEIAELAAADPDVLLSMTAGQPCLSFVSETARAGLTDSAAALFIPSGCRSADTYLAPAGGDGHGFWVVGSGVKSTNDPAYADETFIRFANEQLMAAGIDSSRELVGVGFAQYGWAHVELLRVAASLPGGLTRSNVVLALRGIDLEHPMLLEGVEFAADGALDAFPIEGAAFSRYDAESASWFQQGTAVDLNGSSPNCSWVRLVCRR